MENTVENSEHMESSVLGDSDKGSRLEAPQIGATGRDQAKQGAGETHLNGGNHPTPSNPSPENLEGLAEKVDTLGLHATSKNRCGAARKRARKARLAEDPSGDSGGGQPRSALGDETHTKPGTSGVQRGKPTETRGSQRAHKSDNGRPGALPRDGQAKRSKKGEQLSYTRVAWEGFRVAVVCEDYPESQISKENFTAIQWAIGQLVDELPEGLNPRLVDSY